MRYVKVRWLHDIESEPVELYSELDGDREVRKVEVYRDGRMDLADQSRETGTTVLSREPIPPIAEIARDPQFEPEVVSREDFEVTWARALQLQSWAAIEQRIRNVLTHVRSQLESGVVAEIEEYLDHNELGIALEYLSEMLAEAEATLDEPIVSEVRDLTAVMELDADVADRLEGLLP